MYWYLLGIARVPCIFASDKRKTRRSPVIDPKLCCGGRWFRSGFAAGSLAFLDIFILLGCVRCGVYILVLFTNLLRLFYSSCAHLCSSKTDLFFSVLCATLLYLLC